MFLDFEDHRPETPRVPNAISRREGVLLSLVAHGALVFLVALAPFGAGAAREVVMARQAPAVTYVQMTPRIDRPALAVRPPEGSDRDRRSATPERPKDAENPMPFSRGETPEKTEGAREEKPAGPEAPPAPPAAVRGAEPVAKVAPEVVINEPAPAAGALGASLRNLRRYLQDQNFDNRRGGLTDQDPDIQFDAKGVEFGPWLRRFVAQVKRNWLIPLNAMSQSGRVVITFYVMKDGTIRDLQVVQPSAVGSFNSAALAALRQSNPTLPLPAEYPADRAFFTVTFHYNDGTGGS